MEPADAGARPGSDDSWRSTDKRPGSGSGPVLEGGTGEEPHQEGSRAQGEPEGSPSPTKPRKGEGKPVLGGEHRAGVVADALRRPRQEGHPEF